MNPYIFPPISINYLFLFIISKGVLSVISQQIICVLNSLLATAVLKVGLFFRTKKGDYSVRGFQWDHLHIQFNLGIRQEALSLADQLGLLVIRLP
ncbi:hypothetical protein DL98DRAFT_513540 [Cadophora sp. DSE1049]|nr:hypothetical protein DL98DRAFT_513540 [Cadophora sp. DSE1049]